MTHGHGDHARHAEALGRSFSAPVYVTEEAAVPSKLAGKANTVLYVKGQQLTVGEVVVTSLPVPHDTPQVALAFDHAGDRAALATDVGYPTKSLVKLLSGSRVVLLESNHDPDLLRNGPYPPFLKRRVASKTGHLSNEEAAKILGSLKPGTREVVLMHLSEANNDPKLAIKSARRALRGRGIKIRVASQSSPLLVGPPPPRQLELLL